MILLSQRMLRKIICFWRRRHCHDQLCAVLAHIGKARGLDLRTHHETRHQCRYDSADEARRRHQHGKDQRFLSDPALRCLRCDWIRPRSVFRTKRKVNPEKALVPTGVFSFSVFSFPKIVFHPAQGRRPLLPFSGATEERRSRRIASDGSSCFFRFCKTWILLLSSKLWHRLCNRLCKFYKPLS